MMITTLHLLRKNGAVTDVDATACYDRIAPMLMWLTYFKAGAMWNTVQLLAYALLQLEYFIVTAFSTSNLSNHHSDENQFLGPGQGATDSSFAWALISTYLIILYNKKAHGCKMQDPTGNITWKRAIDMFVDDSYLFHGILKNICAIALMLMITQDIARWSKLLWTSGGAVNCTKSFYSMIIWKFEDNGIAKICTNKELPRNSVKLINPSDQTEQHTIKRKCVTEASKTLGVFKAADLSQTEEFNHLKKKANKFPKALISCPLSYTHAWLGYWTCNRIEHIIKPSLVKKLGLPDTFPNVMLYGDKYFGGIGLLQLFVEQGMNQTLSLMQCDTSEPKQPLATKY
eukprot:scaffold14672_cov61-Attheya_sp.AAC.5